MYGRKSTCGWHRNKSPAINLAKSRRGQVPKVRREKARLGAEPNVSRGLAFMSLGLFHEDGHRKPTTNDQPTITRLIAWWGMQHGWMGFSFLSKPDAKNSGIIIGRVP
ncbi:predicted protein [Histoplasma capsulatum G186AR]|uniref:Uncharacterized protein n=1 Tax=Ajellomyces capsulatus (strain G186AR / H82 / ATCC MYA-2454 / RMSCC 2432) TaxID=447093 RepID=C0NR58_AJECG|nr:uncharacterized protein HCBG_05488 [Histoplasma capsulatum G186AR]EEH06172.1 predicted protein [Histoplasma capsulatum G186AR]